MKRADEVVVTDAWRLRLLDWAYRGWGDSVLECKRLGWSTYGVYDSEAEFAEVCGSLALDGLS